MSSPTSSSPSSPTTTATAAASTISNALFFLVPLFSLALALLAVSHRPRQRAQTGPRPQARIAYAFIALLAILSTLAGALPLSHTGTPLAEAVVQALLSSLLGIPVLHLATYYDATQKANVLAILHSSVLVITLSGATLTALVLPSSSAPCPLYLPPALFLLYSLLALHRIACSLFHFLYPSSPACFSFFPSSSARSTRRPITIHISTQRTSVPLSLPSPASSAASFPDIGQHQPQAIELELALPKRKDSRSRLNDPDDRYLLYQDQDEKKSAGALINHRHQKSDSVDSTTSTVTAVDHHQHHQHLDSTATNTPTTAQRHHQHHRSFSPQLPLIELATPPRAAYTSAVTFEPDAQGIPFSSPPTATTNSRQRQREEHIYRFPFNDVNVSASTENTEDNSGIIPATAAIAENEDEGSYTSLRAQLTYSRSRSLLVFLLAAQLTLLVGYACALGVDIPLSSSALSASASSSNSSATASGVPLRIIQAACTVLAVTGTMAAYLLHAYNTHLSPSRPRTPAKSKSKTTPASAPLAYNHNQSHNHNNHNHNNTASASAYSYPSPAYPPPPLSNNNNGFPSSSVIQIAETNTRPVLIQLAPPPPPRTRRRRVDAFPMGGVPVPVPVVRQERERERMRMDVPRSVSGSNVGSSARRSNEEGREWEGEGDALDELDLYSYANSNSHSYPNPNAAQSYRCSPPDLRYQHLGYDGNPYDHNTASNGTNVNSSIYNARRASLEGGVAREPILLTYEPPVMSGGLSMLEATETEEEPEGGEDLHDSEFEDIIDDDDDGGEMGMGMEDLDMDGDLDLEDEMQKALSRSSSMATTMSGLSVAKRQRRTSLRRVVGGGGGVVVNSSVKTKSAPAAGAGANAQKPVSIKPKTKPKPKAKKAMEDPATYIRKRGSIPVVSTPRRLFGWEFAWDPLPLPSSSAGGRGRRGSVGVVKKSRGTERSFSFGTVREHGSENGSENGSEKERQRQREVEKAQESSFMDMRGCQRDASAGGTVAVGVVHATTRKLKRHSTPAGSMYARSVVGGVRKQEKWEDVFGVAVTSANVNAQSGAAGVEGGGGVNTGASRKLKKKRSQSATRPATADGAVSPSRAVFPVPVSVPSSNPGSGLPHGSSGSRSSNEATTAKEYYNDVGRHHRTVKSGSSSGTNATSRPGTADSGKGSHGSKASLGSGSSMRRGLQLKRSFKMSVGRTLGPGLTLASAGVVNPNERQEREEKGRVIERERERRSDEGVGDEDEDVDVDGEMRSLAAARLVSASIARATPAATIVTAPSASLTTPPPSAFSTKAKSSPVNIAYPSLSSNTAAARPTLPAIVTSPIPIPTASAVPFPLSAPATRRPPTGFSPVVPTPSSARQPHTSGSTWKPHPFADPVQRPMPTSGATLYMTAGSEGAASIEDDVVQLEREMEEIRGRRGDGNDAMDSPTAQFRELAAMVDQAAPVSVSASPAMSTSMTPSLKSMFALAHAQAQNVAPPPAVSTTSKEKEKAKSKLFGGGHLQKRVALSSPPVAKSDWAPQSSVGNGGLSGGGFLYRFPMIFPNSFTGSPPRSSTLVNGQSQAAVPRPSTPRGGSTLRLSAMGSVRSAFAGVGARMSSATSRMSVNSTAGASLRSGGGHGFGQMIMEDIDGDFMDLRDPFASPPPASNIATVAPPAPTPCKKKSSKSRGGDRERDGAAAAMGERVRYGAEDAEYPDVLTRKMNTWGKLPMPVRSFSPAPSAASGNVTSTTGAKRHSFINGRAVVRIVGKPSSAHRKHKKERRARKATLSSMANVMGPLKPGVGVEDSDFGLEEALLSQRLLNRLDSDGWESRV